MRRVLPLTLLSQVSANGTSSMAFEHIESQIGAVEAEEVGVEHLLRDIHDTSVSSLTTQVREALVVDCVSD